MKSNITSVCFLNGYNKTLSTMVSDKLDLYYADVNDYLEFNMVNATEVISKCGVEYLEKLETDSVKSVASFENAVISIEPRLFINKKSLNALKASSLIIYVRLPKKVYADQINKAKKDKKDEMLNILNVYDDYDKMCLDNADIVIESKVINAKSVYKKMLKHIEMYFTDNKV